MALRRVYWHVTQHGRREVVDADLRDYARWMTNSHPTLLIRGSLPSRSALVRVIG